MDDYYSRLIKQSSLDDFSVPLEAKNKAAKITHHRPDHLTETACNLRLMIQRREKDITMTTYTVITRTIKTMTSFSLQTR